MALVDLLTSKYKLPGPGRALPGRDAPLDTASHHFVNGNSLHPPYGEVMLMAYFGMGCFWGAERIFWNIAGVHVTAVGYAAGITPNPTYEEVCSGMTSHNEVVMVVFDPQIIAFEELLKTFWEGHDPTQGMRQGNDRGTQYRSGIYVSTKSQFEIAIASRERYQQALKDAGKGAITTEILDAPDYYFAEEYHQQYLAKNPAGYCGIGGTGVSCPAGMGTKS